MEAKKNNAARAQKYLCVFVSECKMQPDQRDQCDDDDDAIRPRARARWFHETYLRFNYLHVYCFILIKSDRPQTSLPACLPVFFLSSLPHTALFCHLTFARVIYTIYAHTATKMRARNTDARLMHTHTHTRAQAMFGSLRRRRRRVIIICICIRTRDDAGIPQPVSPPPGRAFLCVGTCHAMCVRSNANDL